MAVRRVIARDEVVEVLAILFNASNELIFVQVPPLEVSPLTHAQATTVGSDDNGNDRTEIPLFGCAEPVNDHQTMVTAPPPAGVVTVGYPSMIYVCYNRVSDVGCVHSNDGGLNFVPAAPAFTGTDPLQADSVCGSLEGHLAADSQGASSCPGGVRFSARGDQQRRRPDLDAGGDRPHSDGGP